MGSDDRMTRRLITLFTRDENGRRPVNGDREKFQSDPHWRDLILFYEYFHGDTGEGLGASHQTGWTGVVAKLIHQYAEYALQGKPGLGSEYGLGASGRDEVNATRLPLAAGRVARSDGSGGFASGTVAGYRTRRYHALLLTPTTPPTGPRRPRQRVRSVARRRRPAARRCRTQHYAPGRDPSARHRPSRRIRARAVAALDVPAADGSDVMHECIVDRVDGTVALRWRVAAHGTAAYGCTCGRCSPGATTTR